MNNANFIRTTDKETAEKLRSLGLYEVKQSESNVFVFVNNKLNFEDVDVNKLIFTNKIFV